MKRVLLGSGIAAAAACLLVPAVAGAGTVSVNTEDVYFGVYQASQGERNDVRISADGQDLILVDKTAIVTAGNNCESETVHRARCALSLFPKAMVAELGNRADKAVAKGAAFWSNVRGGPGADVLRGGTAGMEAFDGGTGGDVMRAGGGVDELRYLERADSLRLKLNDRKRNDGGPNDGRKRDLALGFENVITGSGNDRIVGTATANHIEPGAGKDVVRGLGGADAINLGSGGSPDGAFDVARCGAGDDTATRPDAGDDLVGCETVVS